MSNEERCLKLMKLDKYKKDLSDENKNVIMDVLVLSGVIIGALTGLTQETDALATIFGRLCTIASPVTLASLIMAVCRKTNLESKIDDLNLDLEYDKQYGGRRL